MSVVGVHRQHGLGVSCLPQLAARRKITPADISYAMARRPRMGWQTLAKITGVNEIDLRRACGDLPAEPLTASSPAVKAIGQMSKADQLLYWMSRGANRAEQSERLQIPKPTVSVMCSKARAAGLVTSLGSGAGWELTVKGLQRLADAKTKAGIR